MKISHWKQELLPVNYIVKIMNEEGVQIGVGCTAYDSEEARKQIGQRDLKPLIHYDYLYLD